jgi:hypothetical protein
VLPDEARKWLGVKKLTAKAKAKVWEAAETAVENLDHLMRGNVWGFALERVTECGQCGHEIVDDLDACGGFVGDFDDCGILDNLPENWREHMKTKEGWRS